MPALSFPLRGTWIEISIGLSGTIASWSFPLRGTWIEILIFLSCDNVGSVVPFAGNVDWNRSLSGDLVYNPCRSLCGERGLKSYIDMNDCTQLKSFPLRGTWIEIQVNVETPCLTVVVPFAGNVDWNHNQHDPCIKIFSSFPLRGTWIEIKCCWTAR